MNMTWDEIDRIMELGKSDPEEAIKQLYDPYAVPLRKSTVETIYLDNREYNLVVHMKEGRGDKIGALGLLYSFLKFRVNVLAQTGFVFNPEKFSKEAKKLQKNVWCKFQNTSVLPLNPIAPFDRAMANEGWIDPGSYYNGPVYFPHLSTWIRGGLIKLMGV